MELLRNRNQRRTDGGSGLFDDEEGPANTSMATVISGPYMSSLPVAGMTVGEIRRRLATRLDLDPRSMAVIDGQDASSDDVVVGADQCLVFVTRAGEKGAVTLKPDGPAEAPRPKARKSSGDAVSICDDRVVVTTPEGLKAEMPLAEFVDIVCEREGMFRDVCLPDNVRHVFTQWPMAVVVVEIPAGVHRLKWISRDSPVAYGPGCVYTMRTLALPYLIFFATFAWSPDVTGDGRPGGLRLSQRSEIFARSAPLKSLDEEVCLPPILNASKYKSTNGRFDVPGKSISWLCNSQQPLSPMDILPVNERVRRSLTGLVDFLLNSGFNRSDATTNPAAYAEECSWYQYYVDHSVDERIATVERWEEETARDPLFILDVPLIRSGFSVRRVGERILREFNVRMPNFSSADDVARVVLNYLPRNRGPKMAYPHALWPTKA